MRRLAPIAALFLLALPAMAARQIALVTEGELAPPARHGLAKLQEALRAKGFDVAASAAQADYVILAGTGASATLREWEAPAPSGRESLTIWRGRYRNKPAIALRGGDARGLMYAALDTAERIAWSSADPFQYVRNTTEKPYLAERGISMYTMQRAYFESRLYDEAHWKRYFDTLAADRINSFVVIFGYENGGFMAPLYPYFFDVKEFPGVEMVGITKPQQARNTAAFQSHDPPGARARHRGDGRHLGPHLSRRRAGRRHSRRVAECGPTRARPGVGRHGGQSGGLQQSRAAALPGSLPGNRRHPVPHARRIRTQAPLFSSILRLTSPMVISRHFSTSRIFSLGEKAAPLGLGEHAFKSPQGRRQASPASVVGRYAETFHFRKATPPPNLALFAPRAPRSSEGSLSAHPARIPDGGGGHPQQHRNRPPAHSRDVSQSDYLVAPEHAPGAP